jgi:hypothetical protein
MASILDKYAIKEVADVMFYELDSKGAPSAPVLYLDTLKVSTIEQSSEVVDATGGKGNVKLLSWDTNKEITLTLEDALFSAKSLGIMFGGTMKDNGANQEVLKTLKFADVKPVKVSNVDYFTFEIKGKTYGVAASRCTFFKYEAGNTDPVPCTAADSPDFITFDLLDCTGTNAQGLPEARNKSESQGVSTDNGIVKNGIVIDITSNFDSNTYYITGDTFARNFQSGQDEFLQFIVPKGKVSAEDVSLTMEADGDPATFSMSVKCLKANDGSMLKLVKYSLGGDDAGIGTNKGVASVLDDYNSNGQHDRWSSNAHPVDYSLDEGAPEDTTE